VDVVLIAAALCGTIIEFVDPSDNPLAATISAATISLFRSVRLVRVLRVLPGFGLTVAAYADTLGVLLQYATVLLCSLYTFAIVGE
jgi:hypothetical protein